METSVTEGRAITTHHSFKEVPETCLRRKEWVTRLEFTHLLNIWYFLLLPSQPHVYFFQGYFWAVCAGSVKSSNFSSHAISDLKCILLYKCKNILSRHIECVFRMNFKTLTVQKMKTWTNILPWLNPIPGGGGFKAPFRFLLCHCQTPQDWKLILGDFLNIHCAHFDKKSCRVSSGQVTRGALLTPPHKSFQSRQS